ncbi:MAG: 16S rRNA (adenine(1518)-N(6)/adenine(1519)-N(6))-dimethyltransferase RsmA [Candidatus Omnitrophica bacterium]|nr:16S rRNA (adenine(1518)-N(6)/adenine(1519)-N(6))-dimethyltransferase RsmA [Candidatus Omnitrophota bacterium]
MKDFLTTSRVRTLLEEEGINLKRSRGQNFITDRNSRDKILSFAELESKDVVVEIGAGLGGLTEVLVEKVARVYAFEIDADFCRVIRQRFSRYNNLTILEEDFLKTDENWWRLLPGKAKLISNTPYYLSTAIVFHLLHYLSHISLVLLTVQKEVGERLVASPGSKAYAPISVLVSLYGTARICYALSRSVFFPQPEVDSVVVKIFPRKKLLVPAEDRSPFEKILPLFFRFRRKKLSNVLQQVFGVEKDFFEGWLREAGLSLTVRIEQLTPEQIYAVFLRLKNLKKTGQN